MIKKIFGKIKDFLRDGEAIRYIVVGICTTIFNLVCFALLTKVFALVIFDEGLNVTVSNFLSVILSILFAYITNKFFVFRSHCKTFGELFFEFVKFVGARGITMIIEVGGVFLLFNILGIHEFIAKLFTQVIVIIGNYFISKLIVFKGNK
jgi:putative flippase GtrA